MYLQQSLAEMDCAGVLSESAQSPSGGKAKSTARLRLLGINKIQVNDIYDAIRKRGKSEKDNLPNLVSLTNLRPPMMIAKALSTGSTMRASARNGCTARLGNGHLQFPLFIAGYNASGLLQGSKSLVCMMVDTGAYFTTSRVILDYRFSQISGCTIVNPSGKCGQKGSQETSGIIKAVFSEDYLHPKLGSLGLLLIQLLPPTQHRLKSLVAELALREML